MTVSKPVFVGVAGVTGKFAGLILDSLLKNSAVRIRGYCRDASKLAKRYVENSQLEVVQGDAGDQTLLGKFVEGLDVVICCYLGDYDFMVNAQKALVDACDKAHVARYIASDYCFDYGPLKLGDHPAKDPMKVIHKYVQEKNNVKGVHILIGAFMETFWSGYFQVWNAEEDSLVFWGTGEEAWESTTYGDAARYTAAVALDSTAVGFHRFLGDKKNIREIAQIIAETYGVQPKLQNKGSLDDLYASMQRLYSQDPSNPYSWLPLFYQYYCVNGQTSISHQLDNGKYPNVAPQTFKSFLSAHAISDLPYAMDDLGKRDQ